MRREWQISVGSSLLCHGLLLLGLHYAWKHLGPIAIVREDAIRIILGTTGPLPVSITAPPVETLPTKPAEPQTAPRQAVEPTAKPLESEAEVSQSPMASPPDIPPTVPVVAQIEPAKRQEVIVMATAALPFEEEIKTPIPPPANGPALLSRVEATARVSVSPGTEESIVVGPAEFTAAAYRNKTMPAYPLAARQRGQQGSVLLSVAITAEGRPSQVSTKQSSGYPILDRAAVQAVSGWVFDPARLGARPVATVIEVPIRFSLEN